MNAEEIRKERLGDIAEIKSREGLFAESTIVFYLAEIAAQLAETNARDTAAEARMKEMRETFEAFMAGIQQGGLVTPLGAPAIGTLPKKGKG